MDAILTAASRPPLLRAGVQPAIAAGEDDLAAAAEFELITILEGPAFRASPRSAAFLRFVVEETLAGRQELLKERTIGVAILGKSPSYDTGADSGVRVRANDVRKRLGAHYESASPKAGIRIELPCGTYVPRFATLAAIPPADAPARASPASAPPPMRLWQLAAPSLFAVFLALIAIRADVESSDSFSRFWNHALAGRTEIAVVVDAAGPSSISPAMADAAMPLEALAATFQLPVHIVAASRPGIPPRSSVIRLSLCQKPPDHAFLRLGGAAVFRGYESADLWICADSAERLRSAAQALSSRSGFPEIE
jgi:hypothetical protein